ncbi:hypothetical protein IFM89_011617 [Coptis chinensis]|uniref:Bet v I/Major latex protein domain-containing protein n=1 Tax=Coptis chinensis TaxID=261450 RepID=A0A835H2Z8_9MAGN|nr:hypothetical protein IFM89_011617 [Coptis chinensis]
MAGICKAEIETEVKCDPHKFFEMVKYSLHHLPTIFPEIYKDGQIVEGDEKSTSCVRQWKYVLPGTSEIISAKAKTAEIDDNDMTIALEVTEGDIKNHYKHFVARIHVSPKGAW